MILYSLCFQLSVWESFPPAFQFLGLIIFFCIVLVWGGFLVCLFAWYFLVLGGVCFRKLLLLWFCSPSQLLLVYALFVTSFDCQC